MITITKLKKINTFDELADLGIGKIHCDISHRGGGVGFYANDIVNYFGVAVEYLPRFFGAGCNYLGGGLRGAIFPSGFSDKIWEQSKKTARLLQELSNACIRVYKNIESEAEVPDDPINEGIGRVKNVVSAY